MAVTTYGYVRVSTKEQNMERQLTAIKKYRPEIAEVNIFCDKLTGKVFDRPQYNALKVIIEHVNQIKKDDDVVELIIEELDRLGRDANGIRRELEWMKEKGICVRILEIPTTLLEVNTENKWVMDLINQILIEVYSAMAQEELKKREKRQREGIVEAQKRGVKFGRPTISVNEEAFQEVYEAWKSKKITATEGMRRLNIKANTFYRRVKEYEAIKK